MADLSNSAPLNGRLQALLLSRPIEVWTSDDATSGRAYTEQGPRPGLATPDAATHARIIADGTTSGTADYQIRCQHGGLPGQVDHGMSVAIQRTGEPLPLGWRVPSSISGWEPLWYGSQDYTEPSITALPDGTVVGVARYSRQIEARVRSADGTIAAAVTVHADDGREVYWPSVGAIGDELYVLAWRRGLDDSAAIPNYYIAVWRSTDKGATWSIIQDYATDDEDVSAPAGTPISGSYSAGRIRWAYRDGEVVVFAHLTKLTAKCDWVRQWAGAALTSHLETILTAQSTSGVAGWGSPDVVATPDGFLVAGLGPVPTTGGSGEIWARPIGSAWQPFNTSIATDAFPASGAGGTTTLGGGEKVFTTPRIGLALAWDPAGVAWLYVVESDGTVGGSGAGWCSYSADGGTTWRRGNSTVNVYAPSGAWFMSYDHGGSSTQGNCFREIDAVWHRGRVLMIHTKDAAGSKRLVAIAHLGGWHDLCLPWESDGVRLGHINGWRRTWLPFDLPDNQDFTTTTSGTSSDSLVATDGELEIVTGDGAGTSGAHWFQHVGTAYSGPMEAGAEWETSLQAGTGSVAATWQGLRLRLATSNHGVEIEINMAATQVGVRDTVAGAHLTGSPFSGFTAGKPYRFALGVCMDGDTGAGRTARLFYREADYADGQRWTLLGAWVLADDSGAGGPAPHLEFGHIVSAGAAVIEKSRWKMVQWAIPEGAAARARWGTDADWCTLDRATDYPTKLFGRPLGSAAVYGMDGVTIAGRRGPGYIGDTWTIPVSGDYEIARALSLDVPSRRVHHRTVDTSTQTVIPFAVDDSRPGVEDSGHPPLLALRVWCNYRTFYVEHLPAGGAWTVSATVDTAILQGASYSRTGRTIRASSTGNTTYLHRDEVDGDWTVEWDDGIGTTVYRHPAGNSPGRWSSSTSEPRARLQLTFTAAGDPTTGGTLSLWSPEVTVLIPPAQATAWRIRIPAQSTADGDFRTKLAWCEAHVIAQPPSWGRGYTAIPGHERVALEGDLGVRVSRAPASRELRIAWDEGVDETDIGASAEVRYVAAYSGLAEPATSVSEIPRSLVRALERQDGRPVGWCVWDQTSSGAVVLRRRHEQLWGTVESAPDLEVSLGAEGSTEVVRVATMTLREER